MLKFEIADGTVRYIPQERVMLISPHPEEGMIAQYRNAKDEVAGFRCARFQIVKSGTWYD